MKVKEPVLSQEHLDVWNVLNNSEEKYVTIKKLLTLLHKPASYKRKLNKIIYDLVVVHGFPIGSSNISEARGYFIIKNQKDKNLAVITLHNFIEGNCRRLEAVKQIEF
ncbi:hypothetical protein [Staphylococcus simulans]|uniref:hypothetical protein n=1 Tax=Staphylococcus simulans TaxID=1286 RepID=UPI00076B188A|nr:hypothetical protein [Staphylococcus simulans]AMG96658.1 pathogenicity island protein [Staphylococcus simulans]DAL42868.1 MAG TPA_asm: hypothetical protein [Bacteriophage sp.]